MIFEMKVLVIHHSGHLLMATISRFLLETAGGTGDLCVKWGLQAPPFAALAAKIFFTLEMVLAKNFYT